MLRELLVQRLYLSGLHNPQLQLMHTLKSQGSCSSTCTLKETGQVAAGPLSCLTAFLASTGRLHGFQVFHEGIACVFSGF